MKHFLLLVLIVFIALISSTSTSPLLSRITVGTFLPSVSFTNTSTSSIQARQTLSFVGDVMLGRQVETYLKTYGSDYVYKSMPPVSSTTVLVGNFEAPIPEAHSQTPNMTFSFSVDAQHIPALAEYGFNYMSLANNHTYDKGVPAFTVTQEVLRANNIVSFGDGKSFATTSIEYVSINNYIVALVGMHTLERVPTAEEIAMLSQETSNNSDFQIAYLHWGNEYELVHSQPQQTLAYALVDAGFDSVIGSHPHVVQDIEVYKNKLIVYSLGNFIFDQYFSKDVQEGLWLDITIQNGSFVYGLKGVTSIGSRTRPRFMAPVENQIFLSSLAKRSAPNIANMILSGVIEL